MHARRVLAVAVVLLLLATLPFAVTVSPDRQARGVPWGDTVTTGVSQATLERTRDTTLVVPRAEAFYSRYRYAVGYNGMGTLLTDLRSADAREFGRPLSVLVTDFSATTPSVGPDGHLRMAGTYDLPWTPASDAIFVVDGDATLPNGDPAVVAFSDRADARRFARKTGGDVVDWTELRQRPGKRLARSAAEWQRVVGRREARANRTVASGRALLSRPVSVVVGEDAPTLAAAVEQAPPNTTVRLPPGRYAADGLTVEKPLTIRGAGPNRTHVVGDGNGSVLFLRAPRTAVTGLHVAGVGNERSGLNASIPASELDRDRWDAHLRRVHGYGDAGIVVDGAPDAFVSHVRINTSANGVLVRHSPDAAVSNLTVYGASHWEEGFLGVATLGSRLVVQDSAFYGGKVGVYTLAGSGHVVRNTTAEGMAVGVFDLYAGHVLLADNRVDDTGFGLRVAKRSFGNAVVDNAVRRSQSAIVVAGVDSYVAGNLAVRNARGIGVEGHYSTYRENVVAYNRVGLDVGELLPTNRVSHNDVVANGRPASISGFNVLHVWSGNYWSKAPGHRTTGDGRLARAYRPTGPVDGLVGRAPSARVLAYSPALSVLRALQRTIPGLRVHGVVDPAPLGEPTHPAVVAALDSRYNESGVGRDDDPWEYYE